jgi:hypothetical protein
MISLKDPHGPQLMTGSNGSSPNLIAADVIFVDYTDRVVPTLAGELLPFG